MMRRALSEQHREQKITQLKKLFDDIGAVTIRGLITRRIAGALRKLSQLTARTQNDYRAAIHAFFDWLVKSGRWPRNPVASIRPVKELDEPRRRALEPSELDVLLESAPRHRSIIYRLCARTGLRRSEIRKLTREQIDLEKLTVTLRAAGTKAKRWAFIPITQQFADHLKEWFDNPVIVETGKTRPAQKHPERSKKDKVESWSREKPVYGLFAPPPSIKTFENDLETAGIALVRNGRRVVFHSLRATYVTNLWRAGLDGAGVCLYGRFKDVKTAMKHYTSLGLSDEDRAREKMEQLEEETTIPPKYRRRSS